jgi:SAM-dependent methyltransferase
MDSTILLFVDIIAWLWAGLAWSLLVIGGPLLFWTAMRYRANKTFRTMIDMRAVAKGQVPVDPATTLGQLAWVCLSRGVIPTAMAHRTVVRVRPCTLCGADLADAITVATAGRHGDACHEVACSACGLVQRADMPSEQRLSEYYANEYRAKFTRDPVRVEDGSLREWGTPEAERFLDENAAAYAAHIVATLGLTGDSDVLEVGCGDGRLSHALNRHVLACAIEADPAMCDEAESRGVHVLGASLSEYASRTHAPSDAVVSCHVLEHFADPLAALAQMRSLLRVGGKCWIEVPNVDRPYGSLEYYFQWPHLFDFSAHTLSLLLIRAGLDDVHIHDGGHVLLAYGTSGDTAPRSWSDALAHFHKTTGADVPTGADVAARLAAYEERWQSRQRKERAVRVLQAFRGGDDSVNLAELRDALNLLGEQSARAARMAQRAMMDGAAIVELCDAALSGAERYSADPYVLGMYAGEASMAARLSHAVGNSLNAMKMIEVNG